MDDEIEKLKRTARQMIETDRLLGGDALAPGAELPEIAPAAPPTGGSRSTPTWCVSA